MMTKKQKNEIQSIINICNVIEKSSNKEDVDYWLLKIKEICGECLK